jgi:hypothetical protein
MAAPIARTFRARLGGAGKAEIPLIEIPFDVKKVFGKARAPVVITVNGFSFRSTVSVYGGKSLVGLRRDYREAAKVELGELITITLASDDQPRTVEVPKDFAAALKKSKAAAARWDALSYTHRKEHVEAIEGAKKPETRARRIANALKLLDAKK